MASELYEISYNAKGLRGFIGNLGRDLKKELVEQFSERVKRWEIDVRYNEDYHSPFFKMIWSYEGVNYTFWGEFSVSGNYDDNQLVIDRFPGIRVSSNSNWAEPTASRKELRISSDMEEEVIEFLDGKFGESTSKRGNGCPIYKTKLPEEYQIEEVI